LISRRDVIPNPLESLPRFQVRHMDHYDFPVRIGRHPGPNGTFAGGGFLIVPLPARIRPISTLLHTV